MDSFLVIGSGAREHAIIKSLQKEKCIVHYVGPKNIGINCDRFFEYDTNDFSIIKSLCLRYKYHTVIIGPEKPLAKGIVDYLEPFGIHCLGPKQALAQLEYSKIFARKYLYTHNFSEFCPKLMIIDRNTQKMNVLSFIDSFSSVVVKCDGLCGGKGVFIYDSYNVSDIINKIEFFLEEYDEVLLEERLYGNEFSLITLTDGTNMVHAPPVLDFKRLENDDRGPNTGSMGCIMDKRLGFLTLNDVKCAESVNNSIIEDQTIGKYVGFLYGSFMKTTDGSIKVIEFNCRLGDPEGILILESMNTSLANVCRWIKEKTFHKNNITFDSSFKICKYLVPLGYPTKAELGNIKMTDINQFYIGSIQTMQFCKKTSYMLTKSRTLAMVSTSEKNIDEVFDKIKGKIHYRTDLTKCYHKKFKNEYSYLDIDQIDNTLSLLNPDKNPHAKDVYPNVFIKLSSYNSVNI